MNAENTVGMETDKTNFILKICKFCKKSFECSKATPNKVFCSNECSKSFYRGRYVDYRKQEVWSEIRKCAHCGKAFEWFSSNSGKKYCGKECLIKANKLKRDVWSETRSCAHCGKAFEWFSNKATQKFCSKECASSAHTLKRDVWSEIRKCAHCGKAFEWFSSNPGKKYCSKECSTTANKNQLKRDVSSETRKCAHCGKAFEWFSSNPGKKYCGTECRQAATLIKMRSYNGNKKADEQLRNAVYLKVLDIISKMDQSKGNAFGGKYIDYSVIGDISERTREIVLERDGHECQVCRRKDSLQLHHLIKRKNGGNHNAENLITLCASCHRHIETGDIEHATTKCFKNAKRYYDGTESAEATDIDVEALRDNLALLFDKLKETSVGEDSRIMVCLDEALDLIDTQ